MSRAIATTNPDPNMARTAIDAYLASITANLRHDVHDKFDAVLRALNLAMMIGDDARRDAARAVLLDLHHESVAADRGAYGGIAFDRLVEDKRAGLTDSERDQLVADLEGIANRRSNKTDPAAFDPHATESAAERLVKYYRKRGAADDEEGSPPVVMLSHGYWQRRFGGAGDVIGRTLIVDAAPHEIIGVLSADFRFLEQPAEILASARPSRAFAFVPSFSERGIARLKPGVTLAEASADVERMIPILYEQFPMVPGMTRQQLEEMGFGPNLRLLKDDVVGDLDDVLWVLMGTIVMLLLVACANVTNLALVRGETRAHEFALPARPYSPAVRLFGPISISGIVKCHVSLRMRGL